MPGNSQPTEADPAPTVAEPAAPLAQFWADWLSRSNEQTRAFLEALQPVFDPQEVQRHWLDAVVQSFENFMRTPVFREAMRRQLKTITDLKTMQDKVLQDLAQQVGVPTAADITGLFERLNSIEREILGRLEVIETRLKTVEARLI